MLAVQPQAPGLAERIWWGSGSRETAVWAGEQGMNLMSSTLLLEDTQVPFDQLQAEQIELFREAWSKAGHEREPRVSVSRSVIPITSDLDRRLFGGDANEDQVGWLDGAISRFGRSYTGEPDRIAESSRRRRRPGRRHGPPHRPSQLGVDYNAAMFETIALIATTIGWTPNLPNRSTTGGIRAPLRVSSTAGADHAPGSGCGVAERTALAGSPTQALRGSPPAPYEADLPYSRRHQTGRRFGMSTNHLCQRHQRPAVAPPPADAPR